MKKNDGYCQREGILLGSVKFMWVKDPTEGLWNQQSDFYKNDRLRFLKTESTCL